MPKKSLPLIAAMCALALAGCASYAYLALDVRGPMARGEFAAAESLLTARKPGGGGLPYLMELGLLLRYQGELERSNQTFDGQSWGAATAFAATAGQSSQNAAQTITVDFRGSLASGTTDNVTLNNFVVVHYPAQVNP